MKFRDIADFEREMDRRQAKFDGPEYSREELEERRQGRQAHLDSLDRIETKQDKE